MFKGTNASSGIGIGTARVVEEADLVIGGNDQEGIGIFLEELLDE